MFAVLRPFATSLFSAATKYLSAEQVMIFCISFTEFKIGLQLYLNFVKQVFLDDLRDWNVWCNPFCFRFCSPAAFSVFTILAGISRIVGNYCIRASPMGLPYISFVSK